ncbi:aspartyl-phosphate phosphatase Spo0E family protein [Bacillus sp. HMF5848]|uniref:aspartyl-phosphate phosphatase Spo0E family protein n=1 Tax=Bacillus sp. HMF5848 TaxID=2495421 RepID=UPI000F78B0AF|nr:aspartyl-phosphate phosphatase Spo0E family protein [Bacillus sp. HMF5848]RSK26663.1 aspartyl-phosphate phosphatase Spo0E family protein [Bacillus sp. HMF5848]
MTTSTCITKIEKLRLDLIETGLKKGLTHPETIRLSQRLDLAMNNYLKNSDQSIVMSNAR